MASYTELGSQAAFLSAIADHTVQLNDHELLRRLTQVLGVDQHGVVLVIADPKSQAVQAVEETSGSSVLAYSGDLQHLPFESNHFDAAIVAVPVGTQLPQLARELGRVLKPNGLLGLIGFSIYRDQMTEGAAPDEAVNQLLTIGRPAAAYRAVLAESGFTAFVTENRKRDVRRTAMEVYRQHLLPDETSPETRLQSNPTAQVLGLMATGTVGVTLITAEKSA